MFKQTQTCVVHCAPSTQWLPTLRMCFCMSEFECADLFVYCLLSVHVYSHVCGYVQVYEHSYFFYRMGPLSHQAPLSLPTPQKLRLLYLTDHRRGCFPLSTTVPKNVNKPRLGHLGYTFSEILCGWGGESTLNGLPRVKTGPHSAKPRTR